MKSTIGVLILSAAVLSRLGFSHGDHSVPGVTPAGLHGGVVKEAAHSEEDHDHDESTHDHDKEKPGTKHVEKALFFEAVYDKAAKMVRIYPLTLESEKSVVLSPLAPNAVSITSLKIDFPRAKKTISVQPTLVGAGFETKVEPGSAVRLFVLIDAVHDGEKKTAKIQVETSK